MSRKTSQSEYKISQAIIAITYLLLISLLGMTAAVAATEDRISTSQRYSAGGRDSVQTPNETVDAYKPLETEGSRDRSPGATTSNKTGLSVSGKAGSSEFWFFSADVILFGDDDNDSHFFGIDLLFDVDTIWSFADVYAVTYLSFEGGSWNEYAVTEDFTLFDTSADDEYNIVTELETGYPRGSYDLLIEIFDADTGEYLAGFGPEETSDLGFLPLEDFNRDKPVIVVPPRATSHGHGGGGSTSLWMLLAMIVVPKVRRYLS
jgi:hypothetical protein